MKMKPIRKQIIAIQPLIKRKITPRNRNKIIPAINVESASLGLNSKLTFGNDGFRVITDNMDVVY
jgi:hypothetical protein